MSDSQQFWDARHYQDQASTQYQISLTGDVFWQRRAADTYAAAREAMGVRESADSYVEALDIAGVIEIEQHRNMFVITEKGEHYSMFTLSRDELRALGQELINMADNNHG